MWRAGGVVVLVAAMAAVGAACSGGGSASTPDTTATTIGRAPTSPRSGLQSLFVDDSPAPAPIPPGGCPAATGPRVTITVDDNGFRPRCLQVTTSQSLDVVNQGDAFHDVSIADLTANLGAGDDQPFGRIGRYLTPGTYAIFSTAEADRTASSPWLGRLIVAS